jgi:hypothetical protein
LPGRSACQLVYDASFRRTSLDSARLEPHARLMLLLQA